MNTKIALIIIVICSFIIRIANVSNLPSILNRDEAALAYNALLLKETGKDEWGKDWPLTLESFGDFKLSGYPMVIIPSFAVFGMNDFAVRLPSAIAGTLLVVLAFLFAKQYKFSDTLSLLFSFLIGVTPIFMFYSRMAYEANLALTYLITIILIILVKLQEKYRIAADLSAILLALFAVFTYNTPFLLLPFIIIAIPLIRGIKQYKKWAFLFSGLLIIFAIGAYVLIPLSSRKSGITIFTDETVWSESVTYRQQFTGIIQKTVGHKYVYFSTLAAKNLGKSFSPWFLVQNGGTHPWHSLPDAGHLYWIIYFAGLVGIAAVSLKTLSLVKEKKFNKINKQELFLLYLLFISLLPSIITVDSPHATRSLLFFFIFSLFAIFGIKLITETIQKKYSMKLVIQLFFILIFVEALIYNNKYFSNYQNKQDMYQPGFSQSVNEVIVKDHASMEMNKVAVVDDSGYHYILAAWYAKISPDLFFSTIVRQQPDQIGFKYGEQVANLHFIAHPDDRSEDEKILVQWIDNEWKVLKP